MTWDGFNANVMRKFCGTGLFVDHDTGLADVWSGRERRWVVLTPGDAVSKDAEGYLYKASGGPVSAPGMGGSDSPHVAEALRVLPSSPAASDDQAVVHALLAIADELAEGNRQRRSDAIDLGNVLSTLTGVLAQPERVHVDTRLSRWGHLRRVFWGAR